MKTGERLTPKGWQDEFPSDFAAFDALCSQVETQLAPSDEYDVAFSPVLQGQVYVNALHLCFVTKIKAGPRRYIMNIITQEVLEQSVEGAIVPHMEWYLRMKLGVNTGP